MRKILVLGAGLVSHPLVQYLMNQNGYQVTVASRTVSKAERLVGNHAQGKALPHAQPGLLELYAPSSVPYG